MRPHQISSGRLCPTLWSGSGASAATTCFSSRRALPNPRRTSAFLTERRSTPPSREGAIGFESFTAFASRSAQQAAEKAKEYEKLTGGDAVVITPLRRAYEQECLGQARYRCRKMSSEMAHCQVGCRESSTQQPSVYARLEEYRRGLWSKGSRNLFDCSSTVLFMTHSMAQSWAQSRNTRLWLHPSYDPEQSDDEAEQLRSAFTLSKVIYDELEVDGFVHLLREDLFGLIEREQRRYGSWRDLPRHERLDAFSSSACGQRHSRQATQLRRF